MKKVLSLTGIVAVMALVVMSSCGKAGNSTTTGDSQTVAALKPVVKKRAVNNTTFQSPVMKDETQNTAKAKKGWSKAAKGAVIGGASGAVIGAVVNKRNRAAGAAIGGVIGAGGGYVIGRSMDKKDGRSLLV